MKFIPEMYHVY